MMYQNLLSNYLNKTKQKTRLKVIFCQRDLPLLASVLISKGMREEKCGCHIPALAIWFYFYLD